MNLRKAWKNVHPVQITGVALSLPVPSTEFSSKPVMKLASVSVGNTVVVHTIALTKTTVGTTVDKPRYLVDISSEPYSITSRTLLTLLVALLAILAQAFLEIRGTVPELLAAKNHLSPHTQALFRPIPGIQPIKDTLFDDVMHAIWPPVSSISTTITAATTATTSTEIMPEATSPTDPNLSPKDPDPIFGHSLSALLASPPHDPAHVIYLRETQDAASHETNPELAPDDGAGASTSTSTSVRSLRAALHDESVDGPHGGKRWEELTRTQQRYWAQRLRELGHSVEDLGVTVLKGIVFGEAGAAIGNVVGG